MTTVGPIVPSVRSDDRPAEQVEPLAAPEARTVRAQHLSSGLAGGVTAIGLVLFLMVATRGFGQDGLGTVIFPIAGIVGAVAFGRRCERVHPDEPWLPRLLLLGTAAKLMASYLRYLTLTDAYGGAGDATRYDIEGRKLVAAWTGKGVAPVLDNIRETNFIKWLTGVVYYVFGQSLLGGFLLFALLAVIGSYFWYRALACAVPYANKRMFFILMMFAPSVVFWPSALGKEALMQLAVGAMAWATALLLAGRLTSSLPLLSGSAWLLWIVRPHLLAIAAVALAVTYLAGHIRAPNTGSFLARPVGMALLGLLVAFAVTAGAKSLGIEKLSVDAVQTELDDTTASTSQGGSSFAHGSNSLSPVTLPLNLVTVLIRPFPWEASSAFQLMAAFEGMVLGGLMLYRADSLRLALRRWRREPFLLYCGVLVVLYAMAFASFANFGLLNRQRSLVLPAVYVLISLQPALLRKEDEADVRELARSQG